jgi:hypothetical protein
MVYSLCQGQITNEYIHIAINEHVHLCIVMYRCGSVCINLTLASARTKPIYSGTLWPIVCLTVHFLMTRTQTETLAGPFWSLPR